MVVNSFYNSLESSYLDRDDLEQIGYMGLMEAVKHFDLSMGFKFSSYSSKAIMGYISRGLRVSTPWEKRSDTGSNMAKVISADSFLPGSESMTYLETIEDPDAQNDFHNMICAIDQEILKKEVRITMDRVFSSDEREGRAIVMRYGLNDYHEHTLKEIGEVFGVNTEYSRQLVNKGIRRIRSSRAGHSLQRKYQVEYTLSRGRERLSRLEHKDPARYAQEMEWVRDMKKTLEDLRKNADK